MVSVKWIDANVIVKNNDLVNTHKDWQKYCLLGANVDFTDSNSRTALYLACLNERESLVKLLLQYRANPNQFVLNQNMYIV